MNAPPQTRRVQGSLERTVPHLSQKTSSKTRFLKSSPLQIRQLILCSPHKLTHL